MVTQKKKVSTNISAITLQHIALLSPGIDDSSTMYRTTTCVTPERITPDKEALPKIRKVPKMDLRGTYSDHRESDLHPKEYDSEHGGSDSTLSDDYEKNTVTGKIEDDASSFYFARYNSDL